MLGRPGLDRGDLFDSEVLPERDREKLRVPQPAVHARADLLPRDLEDRGSEIHRRVQVLRLAPVELEGVAGLVVHEDRSVAIEDVAPRRHDSDRADPVVLGEAEVILAAQDLRVPVRRGEQREDRADDDPGGFDALQQPTAVLPDLQDHSVTSAFSGAAAPTSPARGRPARPRADRRSLPWPRLARATPARRGPAAIPGAARTRAPRPRR